MLLKNEQTVTGAGMSRANPAKLFGFLAIVLAVMGGLAALKGGLYIAKHEADTLHLLQIVFRMDAGQWPHLDFMTPIGALAYAPIAFLVGLGMGVGHAVIYAQIAMGAVLLPAAWWVGVSRMRGVMPYLFGMLVVVLATALAFGLAESSISISMHYNRWAWAISFIAIAIAILPALGRMHQGVDGVILGACMAALVLIKVTYFAAFAPAIIIALALRKSYRTLGVAVVTGLVIAAIVTLFTGLAFWQAYMADLMLVAGSDVRPQPGLPLGVIVASPAYLAGSVLAFAGIVLLRRSGEAIGGLALLLLVPGFFYVTFQNFGNDPQWLPMLAILLMTLRPDGAVDKGAGRDMRGALTMVAVGAFALSAPTFINLAYSPLRHFGLNAADYESIMLRNDRHQDLQAISLRVWRLDGRVALDGDGSGLGHLAEAAGREDAVMLLGEPLPDCELKLGLPGWIGSIVQDLEQAGLTQGKGVFMADMFSSHWLFGDLEPLINGAPWYYGGLPGFWSADYLLVPLCPAEQGIRKTILEQIAARPDVSLNEIHRTPLYILLEIERQ
ncbi:MAG: hypothetical protein COB39_04395 [Marinosulfonomonas sp.]|nr:MAG: hypothetical protein COB39_04395 [Marinosulfonomonas sp.]